MHACELVDEFFQARRPFEVYEFPALYTDKVVVMCFEGLCELVALFKANLDNVDDSEFREELQSAVDAGALGELAGTQNLLQCHRLVASVEYRKYVSTRFCKAEIVVSEESLEAFHVASIRLVATYLQQGRAVGYH